MKYKIYHDKDSAIIQLSGDVDLYTTPDARKVILSYLKKGMSTAVSLKKVSYIDSSGLAVLVEALKYARNHGLKFGIIGVSDFARNVLELACLDRVFPFYKSVQQWQDAVKQ
jgi:anti-sigma B factor antagonist